MLGIETWDLFDMVRYVKLDSTRLDMIGCSTYFVFFIVLVYDWIRFDWIRFDIIGDLTYLHFFVCSLGFGIVSRFFCPSCGVLCGAEG